MLWEQVTLQPLCSRFVSPISNLISNHPLDILLRNMHTYDLKFIFFILHIQHRWAIVPYDWFEPIILNQLITGRHCLTKLRLVKIRNLLPSDNGSLFSPFLSPFTEFTSITPWNISWSRCKLLPICLTCHKFMAKSLTKLFFLWFTLAVFKWL